MYHILLTYLVIIKGLLSFRPKSKASHARAAQFFFLERPNTFHERPE